MSDKVAQNDANKQNPYPYGYGLPDPTRLRPVRKPLTLSAIMQNTTYRICTEKTGWVRGKLEWQNGVRKLFVDGKPVDYGRKDAPIKVDRIRTHGSHSIYISHRKIDFIVGTAKPKNPRAFKKAIGRLIEDLNNTIEGPFRDTCGGGVLVEPVLYIVGKADRLGTEEKNRKLSFARAEMVAKAIYERIDEIAPLNRGTRNEKTVTIRYTGVGENKTDTEDEIASPKDRSVELMLTSHGVPFEGEWLEIRPKSKRFGSALGILAALDRR